MEFESPCKHRSQLLFHNFGGVGFLGVEGAATYVTTVCISSSDIAAKWCLLDLGESTNVPGPPVATYNALDVAILESRSLPHSRV